MALYEMRKFVAPEFIFGVGARHRVGYYARNMMARRVMVVSDPGVIFAGWLDDDALAQLMGNAIAALYVPQDEDFGMSAVEAMAAGKPLIGVAEGGLRESVVDQRTGQLLPADPSADTIAEAVGRMSAERALSMRAACEARAAEFSRARFLDAFRNIIQ